MKVFELRSDVERYCWLTMVNESDFDVMFQFDGHPIRSRWSSPSVQYIRDDLSGGCKVGDFPELAPGIVVVSRRALESLVDILTKHGEILPLTSDDGDFFAFNVTRLIDALDDVNSKARRFSSGRIMELLEPVFYGELLRGEAIFKVPERTSTVFVTQDFVSRVQEAGLSGALFLEAWSD